MYLIKRCVYFRSATLKNMFISVLLIWWVQVTICLIAGNTILL